MEKIVKFRIIDDHHEEVEGKIFEGVKGAEGFSFKDPKELVRHMFQNSSKKLDSTSKAKTDSKL